MLLTLPDHLLREILDFAVPRAEQRRWSWVQRIMGTCRVFRSIASEHLVPAIFGDDVVFMGLLTRQNYRMLLPPHGQSFKELSQQSAEDYSPRVMRLVTRGNSYRRLNDPDPFDTALTTYNLERITNRQAPRFFAVHHGMHLGASSYSRVEADLTRSRSCL